MGRLVPMECEHGKICDWGDDGSEPEKCDECEKKWTQYVTEDRVRLLDIASDILSELGYQYLADRVAEVTMELEEHGEMCVCGHSLDDHHVSWFRGGDQQVEECEAFGHNETGGMEYVDGKWVEHCQQFKPRYPLPTER